LLPSPGPQLHFVHPGDLSTLTGGYRYARELLAALAAAGVGVGVHRLADTFPFPSAGDLAEAHRLFAAVPDGALVVVDGLAFGAMPALARFHGQRLRLVALVHHPLALETGLSPAQATRLHGDEQRALAAARAVIVTSPSTGATLTSAYGVPPDRITVILPGVARRPPAPVPPLASASGTPQAGRTLTLVCVATLTPRKGHDDLIAALAGLPERRARAWRLLCVGSDRRDPAHAARLRAQVAACGLGERVHFSGELDEAAVDRVLAGADAFVLASRHEGYGMVLAEAVARGLPIVSTTAGAIPETVPRGAGLLVAPGDVPALRAALSRLIGDDRLRGSLAAAARAAAAELPRWDEAADRFRHLAGRLAGPSA